jgi:hypothetical protein
VVEGTDGVGKSTLAKSIAEQKGYEHKWMGRPETGQAFEFYLRTYLDELISDTDYVLDRAHFSEEVYGPIFRDGSEFTPAQSQLFNHLLINCANTVVVHCLLSNDMIAVNQGQSPGDEHHGVDPEPIQSLYKTVLYCSGLPVFKYNYTVETAEELLERIEVDVSS